MGHHLRGDVGAGTQAQALLSTMRMDTTAHVGPAPTLHGSLIFRWFIQYNPFFTASASLVLGGVYVLSQALGSDAGVGLTTVLDVYQWLVIGTAAVLYRWPGMQRPAVILGFIQLVLMCDPTLQLGALASSGAGGVAMLWVASWVLKLRALSGAFRLRLSSSAWAVAVLGATAVAALPNLRLMGAAPALVLPLVLGSTVFGLAMIIQLRAPQITTLDRLEGFAAVVFERSTDAAAWLGIIAAGYHAWNSALAVGLHVLIPAVAAGVLARALRAPSEASLWFRLSVPLAVLACMGAEVSSMGLAMACAVLLMSSARHPPRVLTAAVIAGVASAHLAAPGLLMDHTGVVWGVTAAGAAALVWITVRRRGWSAALALAAGGVRVAAIHGLVRAPAGASEWGTVALGLGFLLLPAGVMLQGWLHRLLPVHSDGAASAAGIHVTSASSGRSAVG